MTYESNNDTISHNLKRVRRTFRLECGRLDGAESSRERKMVKDDMVISKAKEFESHAYPWGNILYNILRLIEQHFIRRLDSNR